MTSKNRKDRHHSTLFILRSDSEYIEFICICIFSFDCETWCS